MSKRKAYRQKPVHVPMMVESRNALAIQLYTRIDYLISHPTIDSCNEVSKILATMNQAGLKSSALTSATNAVNSIIDRYERMKKVGVSDKEAEILFQSSGQLDVLLPKIPVNVLKAARAMVNANVQKMNEEHDA